MGTNRRLGPVLVLQWMCMKHPASPDDARAAISWICPSWFRSINWFPRIALRRIVRRKRLHSSGLPCTSIYSSIVRSRKRGGEQQDSFASWDSLTYDYLGRASTFSAARIDVLSDCCGSDYADRVDV